MRNYLGFIELQKLDWTVERRESTLLYCTPMLIPDSIEA